MEAVAMRLRTRKWGCALGITLLSAVVIALAVWLGQSLMRSTSAQATLRAVPLYPGVSQAVYTRPDDLSQYVTDGDVARMAYTVKDPPDAVNDYYAGILPSRGWIARSGMQYPGVYDKYQRYVSGLSLSENAPWVQMQEGEIRSILAVLALPVEKNGAKLTEVRVQLVVHVDPTYRYIP
jgi:hypothetical protein